MQTIDHPLPQSFVMPHPHAAAAKAPHSACQASDPLPRSGTLTVGARIFTVNQLGYIDTSTGSDGSGGGDSGGDGGGSSGGGAG